MQTFPLAGDRVRLAVTATGGQLDRVEFATERGPVTPLHTAPWAAETLPPEIPPMLRVLRGDFFCAPFGDSDVLPEEQRPHGTTANGNWLLRAQQPTAVELELDRPVAGARVVKRVFTRAGQPLVYQEHTFTRGNAQLPLGHHAMLRADEPLHLSFARWVWGGTPPTPLEPDPRSGRSRLTYPQRFERLDQVQRDTGQFVDLGTYPALEDADDLAMLVSDPQQPLAWSAAVAPRAGWAWFSLRNSAVLGNTTLWLSNGGRSYAPWNSRHRRVIGIEDMTGFFHLGHRASLAPNAVTAAGYPTTVALAAERPTVVRYAFGVVAVPAGFTRVARLEAESTGVTLCDAAGTTVRTAADVAWVLGA
jgi:hypothetical protein